MKILIIYNSVKTNGLSIVQKTESVLKNAGAELEILEFNEFLKSDLSDLSLEKLGAVVVIGGDGTIIKVAKSAAVYNLPIIGINAGRIGYLAGIDESCLDLLKNVLCGSFSLEKRMMLSAEIYKDNNLVGKCEALNDLVISKSSVANLLDIELSVNGDNIKYRADGLIAATPTGSTAYSLSAGGPVVDPSIGCIVLTAVCPHTLMNRSLVVGESTELSVKLLNTEGMDIFLSADGRAEFSLDENSVVKIKKSDIYANFIRFNDHSVYKIFSLKTKLD